MEGVYGRYQNQGSIKSLDVLRSKHSLWCRRPACTFAMLDALRLRPCAGMPLESSL